MTRALSVDDLKRIGAEWATPCGSCDFGLPYGCSCSQGDPRPVVARLLEEIGRLGAENADLLHTVEQMREAL